MATMGLIYRQPQTGGGLTSLGDTLSKALMGDPEFDLKLKMAQSDLATEALRRGAIEAQTTNYGANTEFTQQKTLTERRAREAREAAGPAVGNLLVSRVPQPVPVEMQGPVRTGIDPALPAIVDPAKQRAYEETTSNLRRLGPAIVTMGDNPQTFMQSIGTGAGLGGIISGDLDPTRQRLNSMLFTGTAPDTNTVVVPGDTAGVNAAAEAERLKPRDPFVLKPKETPYQVTTGPDGQQRLEPMPGVVAPQAQPTEGPYPDTTVAGVDRNVIDNVSELWRTGQPIPPQLALRYAVAMQEITKPYSVEGVDEAGRKTYTMVPGSPPRGVPTGPEVLARAGVGGAPGATAPASLAPAPAVAPAPAPAPSPQIPPLPAVGAGASSTAPPPAAQVAPVVAPAPSPVVPASTPPVPAQPSSPAVAPDGSPLVPPTVAPEAAQAIESGIHVTRNPDGTETVTVPNGGSAKLTVEDRRAGLLVASMIQSRPLMGLPPPGPAVTYAIRNDIVAPEILNQFLSPQEQQFVAAWRNGLATIRYMRSGQAATESEIKSDILTFMPLANEAPEVQKQKLAAFDQYIDGGIQMAPPGVRTYLQLVQQRNPHVQPGAPGAPGAPEASAPAPGPRRWRFNPQTGKLEQQ